MSVLKFPISIGREGFCFEVQGLNVLHTRFLVWISSLSQGTDRPPQRSVMEEQMVMEIRVPLSHPWSGVRK